MKKVTFHNDFPGNKIVKINGKFAGYVYRIKCESGSYWIPDIHLIHGNFGWMYAEKLEELKEALMREIGGFES